MVGECWKKRKQVMGEIHKGIGLKIKTEKASLKDMCEAKYLRDMYGYLTEVGGGE